jgi:hypothetical protein
MIRRWLGSALMAVSIVDASWVPTYSTIITASAAGWPVSGLARLGMKKNDSSPLMSALKVELRSK